MRRISTATKVVDKFGAGKHGFTNGNPSISLAATDLEDQWFDHVQEELCGIVEDVGLTADGSSRSQVLDAIRMLVRRGAAVIAAGTADALTGEFSPAITTITHGMIVFVRATAANATTTPTFKADGTTAWTIVKGANSSLAQGDIAGAGHWLMLQGDTTLNKWVLLNPATGISMAAQQPGEICYFARNTAPTGFLKANGAAVSRTSYAALFAALVKTSAVTISIASPGVISWNAHGLSGNDPVKFSTTGALPTGLTAGTTYYVVGSSITTNTFQVSATAGGTAINTSGTQSGAHTAINAPFGDGDGSTTFNVPDLRGEFARGWDDGRGVDSNRSFGSAQGHQARSVAFVSATTAGGYNSGEQAIPQDGTSNAAAGPTSASNTGTATGYIQLRTNTVETRGRNIALLACVKY